MNTPVEAPTRTPKIELRWALFVLGVSALLAFALVTRFTFTCDTYGCMIGDRWTGRVRYDDGIPAGDPSTRHPPSPTTARDDLSSLDQFLPKADSGKRTARQP